MTELEQIKQQIADAEARGDWDTVRELEERWVDLLLGTDDNEGN
jgi:hypothetical protein